MPEMLDPLSPENGGIPSPESVPRQDGQKAAKEKAAKESDTPSLENGGVPSVPLTKEQVAKKVEQNVQKTESMLSRLSRQFSDKALQRFGPVTPDAKEKVAKAMTDQDQLGPIETLGAMAITTGPQLSLTYIQRRAVNAPAPIDAASTWNNNPQGAIEFLSANLPTTPGNTRFLNAMRFHFGTPAMRASITAATMTREDTLAALGLVVDYLSEHE